MVVNEVAWMGTAANAADEWIELYNAGPVAVDLTGWALFKGSIRLIGLSGTIAPGSYYLIERTDDTAVSDISADVYGPFGGSGLKNLPAGEDIRLFDASGGLVDEVPCSGGWYAGSASTEYATMERIDPETVGSDPTNWASNDDSVTVGKDALGVKIRGTPAYPNSVALP